jgi:hypothetical protein
MLNKKWQECLGFLVRQKDRMKSDAYVRHLLVAVFFLWLGFIASVLYTGTQFRILYSLDNKANDKEIIKVIDSADKYVYFAIYYFTKDNIADALIRAKKRGLEVAGITDREASSGSNKNVVQKLKKAGVDIKIRNNSEGIMHLKTLVTDDAYVSGSFNWTQSATISNDEVIEISTNESVRKKYLKIIQKLLQKNDNIALLGEGQNADVGVGPLGVWHSNSTGELKEIDFAEAKNHIGENAIVRGKVVKTYTAKSGVSFLDFCSNYKTCPFTAVIFASDLDKFGDLKQFEREVKINGLIKTYNGKAEIIINERDQIE